MISFLSSIAFLLFGYLLYGRLTEKVFSPDERETPAIANADGVDAVPLPCWKSFLIQLLNIAGTGPIFGALMGAVFGPVVFLWIILGAVLAGAVHDYMCGMLSSRHQGESIAVLTGKYLGRVPKFIMRVFCVVLLVLCGTVFITSPAALLARLTPESLDQNFWVNIIVLYYILATLLPIDKLIGRLYPVFGVILIVMAVSVAAAILLLPGYQIPEITLANLHPEELPVWPYMFVTVACGAISGFHATQCPVIAKCITREKQGRSVFYGAMISESVIALIWAAAGMTVYGSTGALKAALDSVGQSGVVYDISNGLLGIVGGLLAVIGVVICPITSGDTAFRSARLILAEWTGLKQGPIKNRLIITIPLLFVGAGLTAMDFNVLWRYFSWSNQTLAMVALWVASAYLIREAKKKWFSLLTAFPAAFMTAVSATYILMAEEGMKMPSRVACPVGIAAALAAFVIYLVKVKKEKRA